MSNNEFNITEQTIDFLNNIKVTTIEPRGYNYSIIKTSVLSGLVSELERAKQLLDSNGLSLDDKTSIITKQIDSLKSEIDTKDSNLEVLQNEVDLLLNKVNTLQSENDELRKIRDKSVVYDNTLLNRMYFLGYLNCYLTRGNLYYALSKDNKLTLEDFKEMIDELIELRDKNV